jgi:hypothetical protein
MTDDVPKKAGETAAVLSRSVTCDLPANWGCDPLSAFWDAAMDNVIANFAHASSDFTLVGQIDGLFLHISEKLVEPQNSLVALLLLRTHTAYRVAALIAASGTPTDAYPLLRSVLETAGYALLIYRDPALGEIWLHRDDSRDTKQAVRDTFKPRAIKDALAQLDSGLMRVFDTLYERFIELGAHPNVKSLTANLSMTEAGATKHYRVQYIHGNTTFFADAMKDTVRVGMFALTAFQHTMAARFELLGITDAMNLLRRHL